MNIEFANSGSNMDMPAHARTYNNFIKFMRISIVAAAVILILMAITLL